MIELMLSSEPEILKVMVSLSASVAVTIPTLLSFSSILNVFDEVKIGGSSSRSLMLTVIS